MPYAPGSFQRIQRSMLSRTAGQEARGETDEHRAQYNATMNPAPPAIDESQLNQAGDNPAPPPAPRPDNTMNQMQQQIRQLQHTESRHEN